MGLPKSLDLSVNVAKHTSRNALIFNFFVLESEK